MKEQPILFSAPMVRALLAGTKTQTRRVLKPQPVVPEGAAIRCYDETATHMSSTRGWQVERPGEYDGRNVVGHLTDDRRQLNIGKMPFCAGDQLWVRETWAGPLVDAEVFEAAGGDMARFKSPKFCQYAADGGPRPEYMDADDNLRQRWTPAIHMFRRASRILPEVTEVRVERLQDISEADARAEGIAEQRGGWGLPAGEHFHLYDPRISYWSLWEAINGPGSVEANPFVWAVTFRKVPS